ncbi:type VII secretion target [Haloechinothrix sp. LS1_15]|uniref:type VII secretion target n=1 Tax=Haloechinothrix sp. LS1_15 TaxID=2652248 RepID=UPI002944D20B|nr:type VII secretion target [Haloechinothrix sp. LS1_15]MDV6014730.1 hypothetical protein [Haloechinothrix sp. LS1_15]
MAGDLEVDPEALTSAATRIKETAGEALNVDLAGLAEGDEAFGHNGVRDAVGTFCVTWQLATAMLAQQSSALGDALTGAAQGYRHHEEATADAVERQQRGLPPISGPAPH